MLQTILSIISVIIAAVGIAMIYIQLRDLKASLRSSVHTAIYSQAEKLRSYLIEYPHLRKYFFDGEPIASDHEDYNRVVSIAEIYLNYLEQIAVLQDSFGKENADSLARFINNAFDKSPILKQHLKENAAMYSNSLHQFVEQGKLE